MIKSIFSILLFAIMSFAQEPSILHKNNNSEWVYQDSLLNLKQVNRLLLSNEYSRNDIIKAKRINTIAYSVSSVGLGLIILGLSFPTVYNQEMNDATKGVFGLV